MKRRYGSRPGKSAHEALAACRQRCWKYDWTIDLDVQKFFDEVPWDLVLRAVRAVTDCRWVLLYVERWLAAPLERPDGALEQRSKGTPQGSAVSPILANLFMHFAFDSWMARNFPGCPLERYADDAIVHCKTRRQAEYCLPGSSGGRGRSGSGFTRRRRGSSTARTVGAGRGTSTPRSPSSGMTSEHGGAQQGWPVLHQLLARDQSRGAQGQRRRAPQDADPTAHRPVAGRPGAVAEPHRRRVDQLLRPVYRSALYPLLRRVNAYLRRWLGGSTSGCGPRSATASGWPGWSQGSLACSPTGAWSARTRADQKSPVTGDCRAQGGLAPSPEGRRRRANKPPSLAQHRL
jgi:RNA-directed DNA polymerase